MRNTMLGVALVMLISAPALAQSKEDESALRQIVGSTGAAWASHDARALSRFMAEDVDFVTVGAKWLQGRRDFEIYHARLLNGRFKGSTNTPLETSVKFFRPDLATLRFSWVIEGDKNVDGTSRFKRYGLMTMLAEKRKGRWLIVAAQNTNADSLPSPEADGIKSPIAMPRAR